ncbi:ABC transporter permease [Liquorilactobacillus oeni]|uniref:Putative hemin transport system permease protein HrtB n=1 Tax=Liquorilactobacillus oeni DSM 19972 TaxID=1423777 RepID=A0A0R1MB10_9LACO|nr:ABC transporter permease [Liquorilactobacillus oeni]KRL05065.1 hypothetical protein FD46_GL001006 [Liquorilactobacillus oeni DSM 19972]
MFLAIKEIKHDKLRYGLIISLIFFVSYLVFVLTGLASGLSNLNKSALEPWHAERIILNKDAQGRLAQSFLPLRDLGKIGNRGAQIAQYSTIVKGKSGQKEENTQLLAVNKDEFIYKRLPLIAGDKFTAEKEALASAKFKTDGYKVGDYFTTANSKEQIKIVGFTKEASLNAAPVVYISFETLGKIDKDVTNGVVLNKKLDKNIKLSDSESYTLTQFINKLPGYSAQQLTFNFMIGFLFIIILIIISIFLYILTIQKLPNFGVMKAQGIPTRYLVLNTLTQTLIISVAGVGVAIVLSILTAVVLPTQVPISISLSSVCVAGTGIILMSLLGSLIPIQQIIRVDPVKMIGG